MVILSIFIYDSLSSCFNTVYFIFFLNMIQVVTNVIVAITIRVRNNFFYNSAFFYVVSSVFFVDYFAIVVVVQSSLTVGSFRIKSQPSFCYFDYLCNICFYLLLNFVNSVVSVLCACFFIFVCSVYVYFMSVYSYNLHFFVIRIFRIFIFNISVYD